MDISKILRSKTARQSLITSISTVINGGLGAAFYFLVAKLLGSRGYGELTLAITSITLLADVTNFGSDQALIKFVPRYLRSDPDKHNRVIKLMLEVRIIISALILLIGVMFSELIAQALFNQPELSWLVPLIGLGVLSQQLFSFSTSLFQAWEKYIAWGGLFMTTNFLRLISILVLFGIDKLFSKSVLWSYLIFPFFGFFLSFTIIKFNFLKIRNEWSICREVFDFNKWVTAFVVVAAVGARLDTFFTARLINISATGIYGLANQIVAILPQLAGAIGVVTSPKFASFTKHSQNKEYVFKSMVMTSVVALISGILLIPVGLIVFKWTGGDFFMGIPAFIILLLAMVVFLASSPLRDSIIYFFGKPKFFFWSGLIHMVSIIILSQILIPMWGILGSSMVVLLGQLLILVMVIWYYLKLNKAKS